MRLVHCPHSVWDVAVIGSRVLIDMIHDWSNVGGGTVPCPWARAWGRDPWKSDQVPIHYAAGTVTGEQTFPHDFLRFSTILNFPIFGRFCIKIVNFLIFVRFFIKIMNFQIFVRFCIKIMNFMIFVRFSKNGLSVEFFWDFFKILSKTAKSLPPKRE